MPIKSEVDLAVGDAFEDVGAPGLRVGAVEPGGRDQDGGNGGSPAAARQARCPLGSAGGGTGPERAVSAAAHSC